MYRLILPVLDFLAIMLACLLSANLLQDTPIRLPDLFWYCLGGLSCLWLMHGLHLYHYHARFVRFALIRQIIKSVVLCALIMLLIQFLFIRASFTLERNLLFILLLFVQMSLFRWLIWYYPRYGKASDKQRVLIYGAGQSGRMLLQSLFDHDEYQVAAFVDDKPAMQGQMINGIPIHAARDIPDLLDKYDISQIFLAMPSTDLAHKRRVIQFLEPLPVQVKSLPPLNELLSGKVALDDIRELEIEDLLERKVVAPDYALLQQAIADKTVLVSGAGGSIGSELCRQIFALQPKQLIMLDNNEYALYQISHELQSRKNQQLCPQHQKQVVLVSVLGSVQDKARLDVIFSRHKIDLVYHAAAYKHVPLVEENSIEGIKNNVFGSFTLAEAAIRHHCPTFVLISTDKAVRPTNIMGASKRLAEIILQALHNNQGNTVRTRFCMVRFGNVRGSSGSVVPLFKKQIAHGGPVTVTHPEITRYFMTIPEAVQLVLQAGAMGEGGDIFVLDMGDPVKILHLAKKMIHLSGFEVQDEHHPQGDIEIIFSGLRAGEKLYEELLIGDNVRPTAHPDIMRAREEFLPLTRLQILLQQLRTACDENNTEAIKKLLRDPENYINYKPKVER